MKMLPAWAWLVFVGGLALLAGAAFVQDGTYAQSVMIQLGSTALLVVPIVLAERSIISTLRKRLEDVAAIHRTEDHVRLDDMLRHFGQTISWTLPPTSSDQLGRMLGAEGWRFEKSRDGYELWRNKGKLFAIPCECDTLSRGIVLGVSRYTDWTPERFIELWNATRPDDMESYNPTEGQIVVTPPPTWSPS